MFSFLETDVPKGLLLMGCGNQSFRFRPCLTFTPEEADIAIGILSDSLSEAAGDLAKL